jgi:hypothetical protein
MRRAVLSILVVGLLAGTAFAQGAGQITGVVSDNSGGVIPGVTVVAVESETGILRDRTFNSKNFFLPERDFRSADSAIRIEVRLLTTKTRR